MLISNTDYLIQVSKCQHLIYQQGMEMKKLLVWSKLWLILMGVNDL